MSRKRKQKRIFFFDLCLCSVWTLNWNLCEPTRKRFRFRFRLNINEPLRVALVHTKRMTRLTSNAFHVGCVKLRRRVTVQEKQYRVEWALDNPRTETLSMRSHPDRAPPLSCACSAFDPPPVNSIDEHRCTCCACSHELRLQNGKKLTLLANVYN